MSIMCLEIRDIECDFLGKYTVSVVSKKIFKDNRR